MFRNLVTVLPVLNAADKPLVLLEIQLDMDRGKDVKDYTEEASTAKWITQVWL